MDAYQSAGVISAGEPVPVDPVTEQEMNAIAQDKLDLLGASIAKRRDEWIAARAASGVEKRWLEDTEQYLGHDAATKAGATMMETVLAGGPVRLNDVKVQRSTVFVNITRPKTNAAEARLASMLFPTDDLNWGIKPTPSPSLTQAAIAEAQQTQQAQQMQPGQPPQAPPPQPMPQPQPSLLGAQPSTAQAKLDVATQRAKGMQDAINDALTECEYNAQGRLVLHDAAMIGTGVIKGPIVVNRVAKAWKPADPGSDVHVLEIVQETKPASERADPWNVYPDPNCGDNIHNGIGLYERKTYTAKQLRELASQPGYLRKQISKVLEEGPQHIISNDRDRKNQAHTSDHLFELWEYWGSFTPDDLRSCGIDMPDSVPESISGCLIMINRTVIKGFLNPIETGDLPYDFMVWEKADNSPWGYGIPYLCRPAQKVLNAAWRQMMDNAGMSVGPNVVVKPGVVQPADGVWQLTGRKVWNCIDNSVDVRTAFYSFDFPNNTNEFQEIIELALKFADEESAVPKLAQGERGTAPETVGGMTILMNSANVVLTRMVKQFDDMITRPHIRRYYDYMMAYSDDPSIKGDFQVDARGSSALLVRDMQQQALLQFGQFQASPVGQMVNWEHWLREVLKAQHIDPADILKSQAEIEQLKNAPPPPSPDMIKAQAAQQVAQIRAQSDLQTAKARESGELAYAQTQQQMAHDNQVARLRELEVKRELALLQYAHEQKLTLDQVKADLAKTSIIEETKRQIAAADMQLKASEADKNRLVQ